MFEKETSYISEKVIGRMFRNTYQKYDFQSCKFTEPKAVEGKIFAADINVAFVETVDGEVYNLSWVGGTFLTKEGE